MSLSCHAQELLFQSKERGDMRDEYIYTVKNDRFNSNGPTRFKRMDPPSFMGMDPGVSRERTHLF
jgi:hypothetical protein